MHLRQSFLPTFQRGKCQPCIKNGWFFSKFPSNLRHQVCASHFLHLLTSHQLNSSLLFLSANLVCFIKEIVVCKAFEVYIKPVLFKWSVLQPFGRSKFPGQSAVTFVSSISRIPARAEENNQGNNLSQLWHNEYLGYLAPNPVICYFLPVWLLKDLLTLHQGL